MAQSTISARINSDDKLAFDLFCSRVGLNTSSVLNLFIKKVIAENRIPFEVSAPKSVSLDEGRKAFHKLREEAISNNLQDMSLDEINAEIYAYRSGKQVILPDPKDLVFYEVCMVKRDESSMLVTGNIKHFPTRPFIVTPNELLEIINQS